MRVDELFLDEDIERDKTDTKKENGTIINGPDL